MSLKADFQVSEQVRGPSEGVRRTFRLGGEVPAIRSVGAGQRRADQDRGNPGRGTGRLADADQPV